MQIHPNGLLLYPEVDPSLSQAVILAKPWRYADPGGNASELLVDYDGTIARLIADIDLGPVTTFISLFYIFADDHATAPVVEALGRAVARGVRCRARRRIWLPRAWPV